MTSKDVSGWMGYIESFYKELVTTSGNNTITYSIADDVVMTKSLNKLHEGKYITHPEIKEWNKISDVGKELMDKREGKTLGVK